MEPIAQNSFTITKALFFEGMLRVSREGYGKFAKKVLLALAMLWIVLLIITLASGGDVLHTFGYLAILALIGVWICLVMPRSNAKRAFAKLQAQSDGHLQRTTCFFDDYLQITAENANEKNLISGTRYLNIEGMLPFENMVADYIKETGNHVMYRVTPIYNENDLLPSGVHMEGYSVEDNGEGICFNVYCYNNQPEIEIDYATGESRYVGKAEGTEQAEKKGRYILNTSSMKFHLPDCPSVKDIASSNKKTYDGSRDGLIKDGYSPCGACRP